MKRKIKFALTGLLAVVLLVFAIIYVAYPRVLLQVHVSIQRSRAGFDHRWVQVNDWSIPYIDSGQHNQSSQETILMVHGFGDTKDRFIDLAADFGQDYRIMALDLPGFGESQIRLDQDYSTDFYSRVIVGFLDQLGFDSVHMVGYSMGGMLAAKVAAEYPDRFRTLTLLAPAGLLGDEASEMDQLLSAGELPLVYRDRASLDRLMELNFNGDFDIPDVANRALVAEGKERADLHEVIFRKLFDPAAIPTFAKTVAKLNLPTLLIWGSEDRILDVSAADRWSQTNPSIRVVKLRGAGHGLIHQKIDKIQAELREHLSARAKSAG